MSGFHPVDSLAGRIRHSPVATKLRNVLVAVQFSLLVALVICTGVIYLQRSFATTEALRLDTDQMLAIVTPCRASLVDELHTLPGVRGVACTGLEFVARQSGSYGGFRGADGSSHSLNVVPLDAATLELYGVTPIAGGEGFGLGEPNGRVLVNETALRELGHANAQAAVGQSIGDNYVGTKGVSYPAREIAGVVRDFSLSPVTARIPATLYIDAPADFAAVHVKLSGRDVPETLAAIDRAWRRAGGVGEPNRFFIDDDVQQRYLAMLRQAQSFGFFSALAVVLACLGLLGLAASIAQQRTKEIGIRKALGANTGDVLRLLLWQFSKPVLWANLIAWPVAGYLMHRWLAGFAYRIDLPLWLFPAAALAALVIALLTVATHSILVARAKPVAALRHE